MVRVQMRIDQLQYIVWINQGNTIFDIAEKCYISPQAVSKAIKAMEQELNIQLVEKNGKKLILTSAAKLIVKHIETISSEYEALLQKIAPYQMDNGYKNIVFVTTPRLSESLLYGSSANFFQERMPNGIWNSKSIEGILQGKINERTVSLIGIPDYRMNDENLQEVLKKNTLNVDVLSRERLFVLCQANSEFIEMDNITIDDLIKSGKMIYYSDWEDDCSFHINSFEIMGKFVKKNNLIAVVTEKEYHDFFSNNNLLKLMPIENTYMNYICISSKDAINSVNNFIGELQAYLTL